MEWPYSVPNLDLIGLVLVLEHLRTELHTNRGIVLLHEAFLRVIQQQARLTYACIAHDYIFKDEMVHAVHII
jgi:hypothetical protein